MKVIKIILWCIATACPVLVFSQSMNENYVKATIPLAPAKSEAALDGLSTLQKQSTVTYYDGLGRPVQEIAHRQSPAQKDLVRLMEYDVFGRQSKQYLPYASTNGDMLFKVNGMAEQVGFYRTKARVAHSEYAFMETEFEASPLNRVVEQSAPGEDWQLGQGRTIKSGYSTNTAYEVRYWIINSSDQITTSGYYAAGQLFVKLLEDEHGSKTYEYTDKVGNVVLQKVQHGVGSTSYTYTNYVYDNWNRLIAVVPPQPYNDLQGPPGGPQPTELNATLYAPDRIYTYKYDERGRLVEKKVPHKGVEYIIYNKLDQPILTQDAKQRTNNRWSFLKYDALGRVILSGELTSTGTRSSLQTTANGFTAQWENRENNPSHHGYTNNAFPTISGADYLIVDYYDDYDFNRDGTADVSMSTVAGSSPHYSTTATSRTRGLPTGSKVKILGTSTWLGSATFYDEKGRVIRVQGDNQLGGKDVTFNAYNFANQLTYTLHEHTASSSGGGYVEVEQRYTYDHAGRLLRTYHRINSEPEIILSENKYNELGQLIDKKIHSTNLSSPKFLQSIDYAYNIRGWLTHINNADLNDDEYNNSILNEGLVVGYKISSINYTLQEITTKGGEGAPDVTSLALLINDESEIMVEGSVNTDLYQNGESKVIELMDQPAEGEGEQAQLYNTLSQLREVNLVQSYEPSYEINRETNIEGLHEQIYPDVAATLQQVEFTDEQAVGVIQQAVFNYVAGKAGHIMAPEDTEVFPTPDVTIYFYEQNGHNLYMRISDAHGPLSITPFIMARTTANQNEYDYLYNLTNPLEDPGNPNSPRTAHPLGISFLSADLYEGMGTMEAILTCQEVAVAALLARSITNTTVTNHLNAFARRFAISKFGNQFFNDDANDLWGMELKYNNPTAHNGANPFGVQGLYNGNISETTWRSKGDQVKRGYGYQYDKLSRITSAAYRAFDNTAETWNSEINRYNVSGLSYDLNGNILTLQRNGYIGGTIASPVWGMMDNLSYTYSYGDQLLRVNDNGNVHHINDFDDRNTSGNDYTYDVNGNLTADLNNGVSNISYNHLNLPTQISFGAGEDIHYTYDAMGIKLQKLANDYGTTNTTYYTAIGNYTSLNGGAKTLDFIFTGEGRAVKDGTAWRYEYYYKDQLGNTRLGFSDYDGDQEVDDTEITQQSNYYPFGLEHKGTDYGLATQTTHKYLFNGKEYQGEFGLHITAMDWRGLDNQTGRFFGVDPLAEEAYDWTPYRFGFNNPILFGDPTGLFEDDFVFDENGSFVRIDENDQPDRLVIENSKTGERQNYSFADPEEDTQQIRDGIVSKVLFVSKSDVKDMLSSQGAFNPANKDNWTHFYNESKGGGDFDYSYSTIPSKYGIEGASANPLKTPSSMLFLPEGDHMVHNHMNFGNYLWAATGYALGFSYSTLQIAAHANSLMNSRFNGYPSQWDSKDDQRSIIKGAYYSSKNNFR